MKLSRFANLARDVLLARGNARSILLWKLLRRGERRFDYLLDASSIVYDVGGFAGDYAAVIRQRFDSFVYVFEPDPSSFRLLVDRFKNDTKVKLFEAGLGTKDEIVDFESAGEAGRVAHSGASDAIKVPFLSASEFILNRDHRVIDLMKINIEGGEYELLDSLIASGVVDRIRNYVIQFHAFGTSYQVDYDRLSEKLTKTHICEWRYPFVWESWVSREATDDSNRCGARR